MKSSAKASLANSQLLPLLDDGDYVLFVGAGVGVEAGLKPWSASLKGLAAHIVAKDPTYAAVMEEEIAQGRLLKAAELYYMANITEQDRIEGLQAVFGLAPKITPRLRALIKQPYRAIVSTNYDRSLLLAATQERIDLTAFTESPEDIASARVSRSRFLMRLHGRIEVPASLVLTTSHYARLKDTVEYQYFVQSLVSDARLVFFGFSFADPHLTAVLGALRSATRGQMKHKSFALLSGLPDQQLLDLLNGLNIEPVYYSSANNHAEAWDALTRTRARSAASVENYSEARLRQTLAAVLTHLRIQRHTDLRASVLNGAVIASIEGSGGGPLELVLERLMRDLGLPPSEANTLKTSLASLAQSGKLLLDGDRVSVTDSGREIAGSQDLDRIVRGVLARAAARYGISIDGRFDYGAPLREVFLRILVSDGMLLAYSLIRHASHETARLEELTSQAIQALELGHRRRILPLRDAIINLLDRPEPDEEIALDELAAVSFVLCTALTDPALPTLAEKVANQTLFLDASILLPWISAGNPSEKFYAAIIESIGKPSVAEFYLNELVSHRNLALREFQEAGLHDPDRLHRFLRFYSLNSVNAYIAGYGGRLQPGVSLRFEDYLAEVAPFRNEGEAKDFLHKKGIAVHTISKSKGNVDLIITLINDKLRELGRPRNPTRVRHDGQMIGYLLSRPQSSRPFFVTADKRLFNVVADSPYRAVLSNVLFPHQAFSLAQFTGRARGVVRGLARTAFSIGRDASRQMREFYIDRVLAEYEPALLDDVPTIVESILNEADSANNSLRHALEDEDVDNAVWRARQFAQLDQFESLFHEKILAAKRRRGIAD